VEPPVTEETLTVEDAMERLKASAKAAFAAEEKLIALLKQENILR
jgi:hypothetical protein